MILTLVLASGCEDAFQQVVEIELEPHEPRLTIDARFSDTDSLFSAFISHSLSILEEQDQFEILKNRKP